MSHRSATLSDIELKYPFAPSSRRFFETIPIENGLASREVVDQALSRILESVGRSRYEPHMGELVEFSSFFAAAIVASQDSYLTSKFSKREAERAKQHFLGETAGGKTSVMSECFGTDFRVVLADQGKTEYALPFEVYLSLVTRLELTNIPKWKLARQALSGGTIVLSDNLLNDLFAECARSAISEGVKRLRSGQFPKQLADIRTEVMKYVPVQRPKSGKGYDYVEELLRHPVSDGRHRFVWLVLAPYLVNVKKLEGDQAVERIRGFVSVAGETSDMKRFVEYNVRRAKRNGLLPPTMSTLKAEHPDLYGLLPKEALETENPRRPK